MPKVLLTSFWLNDDVEGLQIYIIYTTWEMFGFIDLSI